MYAIYGNIYHQYTPNVSIYAIHGSYGLYVVVSNAGFSKPWVSILNWSNFEWLGGHMVHPPVACLEVP